MATICTLASGSTGNCTLLSDGRRHILIDMGISLRQTAACLKELSLTVADIDAIVITHAHSDHIRGLQTTAKRHGTPIYATPGAADEIACSAPEAEDYMRTFRPGEYFSAPGFDIRPFSTSHDSAGSVGFRIETASGSLGYATDLGYAPPAVLEALKGVLTTVLEANHDVDMLMDGEYPYHLKRRILSDKGHLSNEASSAVAVALAEAGCRNFVLAHLSRENNAPEIARAAVARALSCFNVGLSVAPIGMGEVINL